jgi:acetylornithine/succinyldiaminopimelate/putrescine aminotransferase/acyl-coenzyme A synthetase/AMP-(fatty) acid ligase/predicted amino acid dehydrogenase
MLEPVPPLDTTVPQGTVLSSPFPETPPRFRSFAHLLFEGPGDPVVLLGSLDNRLVSLSLDRLRSASLALIRRLADRGIKPGQTVCLLRLPRTSETLVAVAHVALSAWGVRVLLPMFVEPERIGRWLVASQAKLLLWNHREATERSEVEADQDLVRALSQHARQAGVPTCCLERDLGLEHLLENDVPAPAEDAMVESILRSRGPEDPCLLLTTSGTSGRSKMVQYSVGAFLRSCAAWEQAGLLHPDRLGGRSLCLLFAHSMGLRALWNALWCRSPLCLIPPEWFVEHPERARSFLVQMQPEHVTGGPAVFRTLIELARVFPRLKDECLGSIRCAVSSGAPFDPSLAKRLHSALDLHLHNALGLTETQQVASTTIAGPLSISEPCLGNLLPGVRLRLLPAKDGPPNAFHLSVSSPFGADGYLDDDGHLVPLPGPDGWFDTGDVVQHANDGLVHLGRDTGDFFKDGFGVKIHRQRFLELHANLQHPILHIEPLPLRDEPGLGALVFVQTDSRAQCGCVPDDPEIVRRVRDLLLARLEDLRGELEEMEFRHVTVTRFVCLQGPPPRTPKGDVSRPEVLAQHAELVASFSGTFVEGPGRERLRKEAWTRSRSARLTSPRRGELLHIARLDVDFVAARGDTLTYEHHGERIDVTDFVGGFGGNLLGHRHPALLDAMQQFLASERPPIGDQGSAQSPAGKLAQRLVSAVAKHTGSAYVVRFGSTGSEAVEMAIAHAQLERTERLRKHHRDLQRTCGSLDPRAVRRCIDEGRRLLEERTPRIVIVSSAFHGHSLGARSALGSSKNRLPYVHLSRIVPVIVSPDALEPRIESIVQDARFDLPSLELRDGAVHPSHVPCSDIVAAIVEPVQGEGGVRVIPRQLLETLSQQDFPLILDEIQCGLGRTGSWLASQGVRGHYYLFAKALGGGLAKVSALLIERHRYVEKFDEHYASTFGADGLSCEVACAVLDLVDRDDVPARARERGRRLEDALVRTHDEFPDVFGPPRGRGLMLGLEVRDACAHASVMLRAAVQHEHLGELVSSALFHRHRIRVLPTLSAPNTLRIEPSAYIDDEAIDRLASALRWLGNVLRDRDVGTLVGHLVEQEHQVERPRVEPLGPRILTELDPPADSAARVGFVNHFVFPERELPLLDPSLAALSPTQRLALFHRFMRLFELDPIAVFGRNLLQNRVWFLSIANVADAATLESLHRSHDHAVAVERVQRAVDLAAKHGCTVIALGAYSSIVTANGSAVCPPPGTILTSGNTLTVALAARRILHACDTHGIDPSHQDTVLGVVGATGNIGAALSRQLLRGPRHFHRAVLVSRSPRHFEPLRHALSKSADVTFTSDLSELRRCNVIALAVNTTEPLLLPHHVGPHRTIIGDVSVPGSVSPAVRSANQVRFLPLAGVVSLPSEPDFVMSSHSPPGTAFCCAAEAILLGLEPKAARALHLLGDVDPAAVAALDTLSARHDWLDPLSLGTVKR